MEYICIGAIANTFGVKGELKVKSFSDFDEERYQVGNTIYLYYEGEYLPFTVSSFKVHKGFSMITINDIYDINEVEKYKGSEIYINKEDLHPLGKGEYYVFQIVGLTVLDEEGNTVGEVIDMEETGANNNLRIKDETKTFLIPYTPMFVKNVDLDAKTITVHMMEGLR